MTKTKLLIASAALLASAVLPSAAFACYCQASSPYAWGWGSAYSCKTASRISSALVTLMRVTPRGGRDDIDGVETLDNGRAVVKVRVRAVADGGQANRAVTELLARALGVPKASIRILSGTTSRLKQVAVDGDPEALGAALRALVSKKLP